MARAKSPPTTTTKPHPLNGTYAYFDSELEIVVGPVTTIVQHGIEYTGHFSFTGRYSVELCTNERYYWPVIGGTINELVVGGGTPREPRTNIGYELSFVMFSPNVKPADPTYGNTDLSRFMDSWAGYSGVDPGGLVNNIQLRFLNVTFLPESPPPTKTLRSAPEAARQVVRMRHLLGESRSVAAPPGEPRDGASSPPLPPIRTAWSAFSWQPTWEDFGARSYIRKP